MSAPSRSSLPAGPNPRISGGLLAVAIIFHTLSHPAYAVVDTVYVDNTKACPGGPGTTLSNAYCSIITALANTDGPDKVVAVVGTGIPYREQGHLTITPADSGEIGRNFVLFARGNVTLDGSIPTSAWTPVPDNSTMWRTSVSGVGGVSQVYLDGVPYPYVGDPDPDPLTLPTLQPGLCKFVNFVGSLDSVYVNFGAYAVWPSVNPTGVTGYLSAWRTLRVQGSNVTVRGFTIRRSRDDGIALDPDPAHAPPVRNVSIQDCDIQQSAGQGIMPSNRLHHHCTISNNIVSANSNHGIYLPELPTDFTIYGNTCASNRDPLAYLGLNAPVGRSSVNGIRSGSRTTNLDPANLTRHNHLIQANRAYKNQDSGIEIRTNYTISRNNQSWSNQDHGFDVNYGAHNSFRGDLAWGNNRDGMSLESTTFNDTIQNCVIANNGRDRCRIDWELEVDVAAQAGFSSSYNVIWRDPINEPADHRIINFNGGEQGGSGPTPQCSNCDPPRSCTDPTKYFTTMAAFATQYPAFAVGSLDTQPSFVDSANANFVPLSSSPVIDAADSYGSSYLSTDVRGFRRHDTQFREPNTGTGYVSYVDIGPYEFDVNEAPSAPTIAAYTGRTDMLVSWQSTQFNGDESSAYELLIGGVGLVSGPTAAAGGTNCAEVHGLQDCTWYSAQVRITDVNTGMSTLSNTVNVKTRCTGMTELSCSGSGFGAPPEESLDSEVADGSSTAEDWSLNLECGRRSAGGVRLVAYSVPRALAGAALDLGVFDVAGRRILTMQNGQSKAGRFEVPLSSESGPLRSAGVYFVRLRVGGEVLRGSIVIW